MKNEVKHYGYRIFSVFLAVFMMFSSTNTMLVFAENDENVTEIETTEPQQEEVVTKVETKDTEEDVQEEKTEVKEEKTEVKEEKAVKNVFTYENKTFKLTVKVDDSLFTEDTKLVVKDLTKKELNTATNQIEKQLSSKLSKEKDVEYIYDLYDIYFEENGKEVELNTKAHSTFTYKKTTSLDIDEELVNDEVVHVDDKGKAEIITNKINTNKNDEVTKMTFDQTSFSPTGLVRVIRKAPGGKAETGEAKLTTLKAGEHPILDGTEPFDNEAGRGNDTGQENKIVRSFDSIRYNVAASYTGYNSNDKFDSGRIIYTFTIPYNEHVYINESSMTWSQKEDGSRGFTEERVEDNRVYTFYYDIPKGDSGVAIPGANEVPFDVYVGAEIEGYVVQPTITATLEGDTNTLSYTPDAVTVTSTPSYNIDLKIDTNRISSLNTYDFSSQPYNTDKGVQSGFEFPIGFAFEMKNTNTDKGLKGSEIPVGDLTFDIDLKSSFNGTDITENNTPLLYSSKTNGYDNNIVQSLPLSINRNDYANSIVYQNGNVKIEQVGDKLHVTIANYGVDLKKFPKESADGSQPYIMSDGVVKVGVISVYDCSLIVPIKGKDGTVLSGTGDVKFDASISNVSVKSKSGLDYTSNDQRVDADKNDNAVSGSRPINESGNYEDEVFFSKRSNWTDGTEGNNKQDGTDSAIKGSETAVTVVYDESKVGSSNINAHTIAFDQFLKIDNVAFEPDVLNDNGTIDTNKLNTFENRLKNDYGYMNIELLYVGKTGGWDHKGLKPYEEGYDEEMLNTYEDDESLTYYSSYADLLASGQECVGFLLRGRGCNTSLTSSSFGKLSQAFLKVKDDLELVDPDSDGVVRNVYITQVSTKAWLAGDLHVENGPTTLEEFKTYSQEHPDTFAEVVDGKMVIKQDPSVDIHNNDYKKAKYSNTGYVSGETTGFSVGDSMYIIPYKTIVNKGVAQKNSDNNSKDVFNIDTGERTADYVIATKMQFGQTPSVSDDWYTTVTYTDVLPEKLTYIEGSAYWDGTYTQGGTGQAGTVTGGTKIEPEVTKNNDGTTTLKWVIEHVKVVNGDLPEIHYSAVIGDSDYPDRDVKNNETLKNTVTVSTLEDQRKPSRENGLISDAGITVIKSNAFNIAKFGDDSIELDGKGTFHLVINNSTTSNKNNIYGIDYLPTNVDKNAYSITKLNLNLQALRDYDDVEIYYTDEENPKAGLPVAESENDNVDAEVIDYIKTHWTKATLDTTTGDIDVSSWPKAIAYVDPVLPAQRTAHITFEYKADKAKKGERFTNALDSVDDIRSTASVDVYSRELSGVAFYDANKDGSVDDKDTVLKNVTATLQKYNAEEDKWETVDTTTTDNDGYYHFGYDEDHKDAKVIHSGDYRVVFTNHDNENYKVTKTGDKEEEKTSKATGNYDDGVLENAVITDIHFNTIEEMKEKKTKHQDIPHQNVGYILTNEKTADPEANTKVKIGDTITYTISYYNYNDEKADIIITDTLDENVEFVSATDEGTNENGTVTWTLEDVAANTKGTVSVTVKVLKGAVKKDEVSNTAKVKVGKDSAVDTNTVKHPVDSKVTRSITGTTWKDKEGNTTKDSEDTPIKDMTVVLYKYNETTGKYEEVTSTQTDDNGDYKFEDLDEGKYRVVFKENSPVTQSGEEGKNISIGQNDVLDDELVAYIEDIELPSDEDIKKTGEVTYVKENQNAGFVEYTRSLEGTAWFDENKDGTRDEDEELYSDKTVSLMKVVDGKLVDTGKTTTTDSKGHYKFEDLEPGDYMVIFDIDEYVTKKADKENGTNSIAVNDENNGKKVAVINNITLPTNKEIYEMIESGKDDNIKDRNYNLPYQDAGFIKSEVTKKADNTGELTVGDEVTYTISYYNTHSTNATVIITDTLDKNVEFVSASDEGKFENGVVTWKVDTDAYTKGEVTLTVKVLESAVKPRRIDNTATVQIGNDSSVDTNTVTNDVDAPVKRSISGIAWLDKDHNGTKDEKDKVLDNITVDLYKFNEETGKYEKVDSVQTDENGNYTFDDVESGEFKVVFRTDLPSTEKSDSSDGTKSIIDTDKDGDELTGIITNIIMPTDDEIKDTGKTSYHLPHQDGGFVEYSRSLEGTAWLDENKDGTRDDNEELFSDKEVSLVKVVDGKVEIISTTTTDKNGHYKFEDLEPGDYMVIFDIDEYVTKKADKENGTNSIAVNEDNDGKKVAVISSITLPTNKEIYEMIESGKDDNIKENNYNLPYQDAGFVRNEVKKSADKTDELTVGDEITYTISYYNTHSTKTTVTITDTLDKNVKFVSASDKGTYKDGVVTWKVDTDAYTKGEVTLTVKVLESAVKPRQIENTATVQVGNDSSVDTNTVKNPVDSKVNRSLSGIAWLDKDHNGTKDNKDTVLKDVTIVLYKYDETSKTYKKVSSTTTDSKGYYEFNNLEEGQYQIVFEEDRDTTTKSDSSDGTKSIADSQTKSGKLQAIITSITLPSDDEIKETGKTSYHLPHQDAGFIDYSRSIEGTAWFDKNKDGIRDEDEQLLSNKTVTLYKEENGKLIKVATTTTDSKGHYIFEDVQPGEYKIAFSIKDKVTKKGVGPEGYNSKAISENDEAWIMDITIPTNAQMKEMIENGELEGIHYTLENQDAGFIKEEPDVDIITPGEDDDKYHHDHDNDKDEDEELIEEVEEKSTVDTSDNSQPYLWATMMGLSLIGLLAYRRKGQDVQ